MDGITAPYGMGGGTQSPARYGPEPQHPRFVGRAPHGAAGLSPNSVGAAPPAPNPAKNGEKHNHPPNHPKRSASDANRLHGEPPPGRGTPRSCGHSPIPSGAAQLRASVSPQSRSAPHHTRSRRTNTAKRRDAAGPGTVPHPRPVPQFPRTTQKPTALPKLQARGNHAPDPHPPRTDRSPEGVSVSNAQTRKARASSSARALRMVRGRRRGGGAGGGRRHHRHRRLLRAPRIRRSGARASAPLLK